MGTFKRVNDKAAFKNLAVPQGGDLLYDEEVKQVAAKTGTDYLVKAGNVNPLLPTHGFQTLTREGGRAGINKNVTNAGSQLTWEGGRAGINKNVTNAESQLTF